MNNKKYQKYLSKYLKGASSNNEEIFNAFKRSYGHLTKEGLTIVGLASLGDQTVISVSYTEKFDSSKIPNTYRGLQVR